MGIVTTTVARVAAAGEVEAVYRQDGDRLWRALFAFAGNEDVALDAVAEAFAQVLRAPVPLPSPDVTEGEFTIPGM